MQAGRTLIGGRRCGGLERDLEARARRLSRCRGGAVARERRLTWCLRGAMARVATGAVFGLVAPAAVAVPVAVAAPAAVATPAAVAAPALTIGTVEVQPVRLGADAWVDPADLSAGVLRVPVSFVSMPSSSRSRLRLEARADCTNPENDQQFSASDDTLLSDTSVCDDSSCVLPITWDGLIDGMTEDEYLSPRSYECTVTATLSHTANGRILVGGDAVSSTYAWSVELYEAVLEVSADSATSAPITQVMPVLTGGDGSAAVALHVGLEADPATIETITYADGRVEEHQGVAMPITQPEAIPGGRLTPFFASDVMSFSPDGAEIHFSDPVRIGIEPSGPIAESLPDEALELAWYDPGPDPDEPGDWRACEGTVIGTDDCVPAACPDDWYQQAPRMQCGWVTHFSHWTVQAAANTYDIWVELVPGSDGPSYEQWTCEDPETPGCADLENKDVYSYELDSELSLPLSFAVYECDPDDCENDRTPEPDMRENPSTSVTVSPDDAIPSLTTGAWSKGVYEMTLDLSYSSNPELPSSWGVRAQLTAKCVLAALLNWPNSCSSFPITVVVSTAKTTQCRDDDLPSDEDSTIPEIQSKYVVECMNIQIVDTPDPDDGDHDGYTPAGGDCNDENGSIHPGASEVPYDFIDQDCDGADVIDADGDGYAGAEVGGPDCDDTDGDIHPGATDSSSSSADEDCGGSSGSDPQVGLGSSSYGNIAEALEAALPGATVWVGAGSYDEGDLEVPAGVQLRGIGGPYGGPVVNATGYDYGFRLTAAGGADGDSLLEGFEVYGASVAGVYVEYTSPAVRRVYAHDNLYGIQVLGDGNDDHSLAALDQLELASNAYHGLQAYYFSGTLSHFVARDNDYMGLDLEHGGRPQISHGLIEGNGTRGIYLYVVYPVIRQCTVVENGSYGIYWNYSSTSSTDTVEVYGTIFADNGSCNIKESACNGSSARGIYHYNDLSAPDGQCNMRCSSTDLQPDSTNLVSAPGLQTDVMRHLPAGSSLVDAGDSADFDADGTRAAIGHLGGTGGDGWNLDGDAYAVYFWAGALEDVPGSLSAPAASFETHDRSSGLD